MKRAVPAIQQRLALFAQRAHVLPMLKRMMFPVVVLVNLAAVAQADEKIVAQVGAGEKDGVSFSEASFAYESCEEECHVASLICEQSTAISLTLADVNSAAAAKAIQQEQKQITLTAGAATFDYFIYEMQFAEMTGSWWLTAREQGSAPGAIAAAISGATSVVLQAADVKVTLPVDQAVKDWAKACK